jgi:hypothetical protein
VAVAEMEDDAEEGKLDWAGNIIPFPEPPGGMLFAVADDRDRDAHERVSELIEDVLATAPRRISSVTKQRRIVKVPIHPFDALLPTVDPELSIFLFFQRPFNRGPFNL